MSFQSVFEIISTNKKRLDNILWMSYIVIERLDKYRKEVRQMLYRIFTEDGKQYRENVKQIVNRHFDGYTLLSGRGYWKGKGERSLVIEVVCGKDKENAINSIANEIKVANLQEAVLIQRINNNQWLV